MSIRSARRRVFASVAVPAVTGLIVTGAGVAQPAAQAAQRAPALHTVATIALGSTSNIFKNIFTEAPDGTVFFSKGPVVWVQKGNSAPHVALHVRRPVLALAANTADLFVETGLTVTEYSRAGGAKIRHWRLTSPATPITFAGLLVVGHTLWSWTDWGTDSSGFEFARISRINTTASAVHIVDRRAYPVDVAANKSGAYFEDARGPSNLGYLVHSTPTGVRHARRGPVNALLALAYSKLEQLAFHNDGHQYVDSYSPTTLLRLSSARVSNNARMFAGTGLGLLVLKEPCTHLTCASATVSKLATNGTVSGTLTVPNAFAVLTGPKGVVVRVSGGHMSLSRIAS